MTIEVHIHSSFFYGELNDSEWLDLPFLSDNQLESLATFIERVSKGDLLRGRNKPSYECGQYQDFWAEYEAWHYHSGPTMTYENGRQLTSSLSHNENGDTSEEVIHYRKINSGNAIVIFGYSPKHVPFPRPDTGQSIFSRLEDEESLMHFPIDDV